MDIHGTWEVGELPLPSAHSTVHESAPLLYDKTTKAF